MDTTRETGAGRWTPLLGTLTTVMMLVAIFGIGGSTPDTEDGAAKILHYYTQHSTQQEIAAYLLGLSGITLLLFGAPLRQRLTAGGSRSSWLTVASAGLAVTSAGMLLAAGTHFSLAQEAKHVGGQGALALNTMDGAGFFALFGGIAGLQAAVVAASWRGRLLPRAFLILGGLFAVISVSPVGYIGGLLSVLWVGALGIYMTVRPAPVREQVPA
jgi:hypothetical protein